MLEQSRIDEIKARCEAATPGPWKKHDKADYSEIHNTDTWGKALAPIALVADSDDALFIAHAKQDMTDLLAEINQLNYTLTGVMHFVDKWFDDPPKVHEVNRAAEARSITLKAIEELRAENERLREKLGAAISDLREYTYCDTCGSGPKSDFRKYPCHGCNRGNEWHWRGPQTAEKGRKGEDDG
jgi:hypothetical protein